MKFGKYIEKIEEAEIINFQDYKNKKSSSKNIASRDVNEPKDMDKSIKIFLGELDKRMKEYYTRMKFTNLSKPEHSFTKGGRYIKVWRKSGPSKSIVAFIDNKEGPTYGSIYKPASYKAPAKGIRGNIFSTQNGMEAIGAQGSVIYFR